MVEYWEKSILFHCFNQLVAVLLFSKVEVLIKLLRDLMCDERAICVHVAGVVGQIIVCYVPFLLQRLSGCLVKQL